MHTTQHLQEKNKKTATAKSVGEGPGEGFFTEERRPKRYELFPWFRHFLGKNSCMRIGSSSEWWLLLLLLLLYLRYSKSVQPLYEPVNMSDLYCPLNLLTCLRPDTGRPNIESLFFLFNLKQVLLLQYKFQRPLVCPTIFYISSTKDAWTGTFPMDTPTEAMAHDDHSQLCWQHRCDWWDPKG